MMAQNEQTPSLATFGASAISAVSPIVGAVIQQIASAASQRSQNAYNSPQNQMARLRAAGLNPYAFQSQIAGANTQSKPTQIANYQQMVSDMFDNVTKIANIKLASTNAGKTAEEARGLKLDNDFKQQTLEWRAQQVYLASVKTRLENELTRGKITYQDYANAIKKLDAQWNAQMMAPIGDLFNQWKSGNISGFSPRMLSYLNQPFNATAMYPLYRAGVQYDVWRKKIAWNYENTYNMPWTSNDSTMKFIRMAENALYTATGKTFPELIKDVYDRVVPRKEGGLFGRRSRRKPRSAWRVPQSYSPMPGTNPPMLISYE